MVYRGNWRRGEGLGGKRQVLDNPPKLARKSGGDPAGRPIIGKSGEKIGVMDPDLHLGQSSNNNMRIPVPEPLTGTF